MVVAGQDDSDKILSSNLHLFGSLVIWHLVNLSLSLSRNRANASIVQVQGAREHLLSVF